MGEACSEENCDRPRYARGLCSLHWKRTVDKSNWVSRTPEYTTWVGMKDRCYNPSNTRYAGWGGRGIEVASEWIDNFGAFLAYVGPRPSSGHSIDRIDNDGNYEPGNVRWATWHEQRTNQRPQLTCKRGHDISEGSPNLRVNANGFRRCETCSLWRNRCYAAKRAGQPLPPPPGPDDLHIPRKNDPTRCHAGHDLTPGSEHVRYRPDGNRDCRTCRAERQRRARAAQKALAANPAVSRETGVDRLNGAHRPNQAQEETDSGHVHHQGEAS